MEGRKGDIFHSYTIYEILFLNIKQFKNKSIFGEKRASPLTPHAFKHGFIDEFGKCNFVKKLGFKKR